MAGLLLAALGLALVAWHLRALGGRISLHPRWLKTPPGSAAAFSLGAAAVGGGGILTIAAWGNGGIFFLILLGIAFVVTLLASSARRTLMLELRAAYENQRRVYPDLDEEAIFRFMLKERHPEWDSSRIGRLTEDCTSLEELALKLRAEEG